MAIEVLAVSVGAGAIGTVLGWAIPKLLDRSTVGTRYRTENDCANCEIRRVVVEIRNMARELAIKAGVPVHEALKVGEVLDKWR